MKTTKRNKAKPAAKKTSKAKPAAKKTSKAKPSVKTQGRLTKKSLSEKELATQRGEPWVSIINTDVDTDNPMIGSFELDWNDKFIANLVRAGFRGKTDAEIVDSWFQAICLQISKELLATEQTNTASHINRQDIGGGKSVIS